MSNEESEDEKAPAEAEELAEEEEAEETAKEPEEPIEEKEKPTQEEKEEDIVEERIVTVPLGKAWIGPRKKHSPRAIRLLRIYMVRHMKVDEDAVRITDVVNKKIWQKGIEKPPRKIRVRATKDSEGIVTVRPVEGD